MQQASKCLSGPTSNDERDLLITMDDRTDQGIRARFSE